MVQYEQEIPINTCRCGTGPLTESLHSELPGCIFNDNIWLSPGPIFGSKLMFGCLGVCVCRWTSHSCTSSSTRLSSPTCILQLQSSPSPYHSGQLGERITPPGPVRSPPHCAAERREERWHKWDGAKVRNMDDQMEETVGMKVIFSGLNSVWGFLFRLKTVLTSTTKKLKYGTLWCLWGKTQGKSQPSTYSWIITFIFNGNICYYNSNSYVSLASRLQPHQSPQRFAGKYWEQYSRRVA